MASGTHGSRPSCMGRQFMASHATVAKIWGGEGQLEGTGRCLEGSGEGGEKDEGGGKGWGAPPGACECWQ
eukprot:364968-Chlamydomonas_euryale.AAC.1